MSRFLLILVPLAAAQPQWNWNPFQQLGAAPQQPQPQVWNQAVADPALARQQRIQEIYGIPGKRNANQKLRTCCRNLKDADVECRRRFCDFNALSANQVLGFMAQCASKGPTVGKMWDCASSRADHTQCCRSQGVPEQCLAYCETTKGVPTDYLKYIVCLSQFDKIRNCFHNYLQTHPNIQGDS